MFAAAATVAQMAFDAAIQVAKWIATKALVMFILMMVLPWILKNFIVELFEYFTTNFSTFTDGIMDFIQSMTASAGVELNVTLTGVGGYLAQQTGLIDYCSIIISGWGLYWVVAILAKTPRMGGM